MDSMKDQLETANDPVLEDDADGNFYVFEALDGVGKTSTAEEFANRIGADYLDTHDPYFEDFKPRVKHDDVSVGTNMLFYLGSNSLRSDQIKEKLNKGTDVVMDRYFHSTLAFHYAKSGEEPLDHLDTVKHFNFVEPDESFYLWVNEDERLRRIDERGEEGHRFETDTDFMMRADEAYRELANELDMHLIETVGGVDTVVDQVERITGDAEINYDGIEEGEQA